MVQDAKQHDRWAKRNRRRVLLSLAAVVAISLLVWGGYAASWTGFRGKTIWDWFQLLIIPVVLAGAALWFNWQQSKVEREVGEQRRKADLEIAEQHRKVDLEIAADQQREDMLQEYLNRMSELLLDKDVKLRESKEEDVIRDVARARTLTVLRRMDGERKGVLLKFLCEAGLINRGGWHVVLGGADLSFYFNHRQSLDISGHDLETRPSVRSIGGTTCSWTCAFLVVFCLRQVSGQAHPNAIHHRVKEDRPHDSQHRRMITSQEVVEFSTRISGKAESLPGGYSDLRNCVRGRALPSNNPVGTRLSFLQGNALSLASWRFHLHVSWDAESNRWNALMVGHFVV